MIIPTYETQCRQLPIKNNMRMWQSILLGKLSISILASLAVGGYCVSRPWYRDNLTISESASWIGAGAFLLLFAIAQLVMIYFMFRKKRG